MEVPVGSFLKAFKTITRNCQHREPDFYAFLRKQQFTVNWGQGYTEPAGVSYFFKTDCRWFSSKLLMVLAWEQLPDIVLPISSGYTYTYKNWEPSC